jgi:hypothetical protein
MRVNQDGKNRGNFVVRNIHDVGSNSFGISRNILTTLLKNNNVCQNKQYKLLNREKVFFIDSKVNKAIKKIRLHML